MKLPCFARRLALFTAACSLLGAASSWAWLQGRTAPVSNTMALGAVTGGVTETVTGGEKTNVAVQNTGSVAAYVRVLALAGWRQNGALLAAVPREGADYTVVYAQNDDWVRGADGVWYYRRPVPPGGSTAVLIEACRVNRPDASRTFQYEVLTSLIEAGTGRAVAAWSSPGTTVAAGENGLLNVTAAGKGGTA